MDKEAVEKATREHVRAVSERARRQRAAADGNPEPLTPAAIQDHVLSMFAYHCGVIMTERYLSAFYLGVPGGVEVHITVKVTSYAHEGEVSCWDQCQVNGVDVGNRSGARDEYARLCAPVIAAAFAAK